jgi:hypothetical protein
MVNLLIERLAATAGTKKRLLSGNIRCKQSLATGSFNLLIKRFPLPILEKPAFENFARPPKTKKIFPDFLKKTIDL